MKKHVMLATLTAVLLLMGCTTVHTLPAIDVSASVEQTSTISAAQSEVPAQSAPPVQESQHKQGAPEDAVSAQMDDHDKEVDEADQNKVPPVMTNADAAALYPPLEYERSPVPPLVNGEKQIYQTLYATFSPMVKKIPLDIINDTDAEMGAGDYLRLQRLENGVWVEVPTLPLPESDAPLPLHPSISPPFISPHIHTRDYAPIEKLGFSNYDNYSLPLKVGQYRLIDEFKSVSNSFEILSAPSETQRVFIEHLKNEPALKGATFLPHDFTVPFVCQGVISDSEVSSVKLYVFFFADDLEARAVYDRIKQEGYVIPRYWRINNTFRFGEDQHYNWEDTPHFFLDGSFITLYCGDDQEIINALPVDVVFRNPL